MGCQTLLCGSWYSDPGSASLIHFPDTMPHKALFRDNHYVSKTSYKSGLSRETKPIGYIDKEIYYQDFAHVIMEANESKNRWCGPAGRPEIPSRHTAVANNLVLTLRNFQSGVGNYVILQDLQRTFTDRTSFEFYIGSLHLVSFWCSF